MEKGEDGIITCSNKCQEPGEKLIVFIDRTVFQMLALGPCGRQNVLLN